MKPKIWIRTIVLAAVLARPAVETYRYCVARQQLAASLDRQHSVQIELARLQSVHVAAHPAPAPKP